MLYIYHAWLSCLWAYHFKFTVIIGQWIKLTKSKISSEKYILSSENLKIRQYLYSGHEKSKGISGEFIFKRIE